MELAKYNCTVRNICVTSDMHPYMPPCLNSRTAGCSLLHENISGGPHSTASCHDQQHVVFATLHPMCVSQCDHIKNSNKTQLATGSTLHCYAHSSEVCERLNTLQHTSPAFVRCVPLPSATAAVRLSWHVLPAQAPTCCNCTCWLFTAAA